MARKQTAAEAAAKAADLAARQRARRAEVVSRLPQARNPRAPIYVPFEPGRATQESRQSAARIRENAEAQKLQNLGRRLKQDFRQGGGDIYSVLRDRMTPGENRRYLELTGRLARLSQQTLAIYFHHEYGSGEFSQVVKDILYPPDGGSADDGLDRLELLVERAERGESLYGPRAVGRLRV